VPDEHVTRGGIASEKPAVSVWTAVKLPFLQRHQPALERTFLPGLPQAVKALMPLCRICDPTAAFAFSRPPPFVAPLFPSPAVKSFTLAPSLSRWFRRWGRSRADLKGKSRPRLYLHLRLRRLYADGATQKECDKRAECGLHGGSFRVVVRTH